MINCVFDPPDAEDLDFICDRLDERGISLESIDEEIWCSPHTAFVKYYDKGIWKTIHIALPVRTTK